MTVRRGPVQGVYFVQTDDGVAVVKGARRIAPELFATMLGLRLGVYAPRMRIVRSASAEGVRMLERLRELDPSWRVICALYDQAHVLVQEYVPGVQLGGLSTQTAAALLHGDGHAPDEATCLRLRDLGALMALDALTNNGYGPAVGARRRGPRANRLTDRGPAIVCRCSGTMAVTWATSCWPARRAGW